MIMAFIPSVCTFYNKKKTNIPVKVNKAIACFVSYEENFTLILSFVVLFNR